MGRFHGSTLTAILPLVLLLGLSSGCTYTYPLNATTLEHWPPHKQQNLKVDLVLPDAYSQYTYDWVQAGAHTLFPIGPALTNNTIALSKQAFAHVSVRRGKAPQSPEVDAVLTPKVTDFELSLTSSALDGSHPMKMSVDVEWTMTDPKGKLLWVKTVRGAVEREMGLRGFGDERVISEHVDLVMADLFAKSLVAITAASNQITPVGP